MTNHELMPKHGERVGISEIDASKIIKHICKLQQDASLNLSDIIGMMMINDKT